MPDGNFASKDGVFVAVSFDAGNTTLGKFGYNHPDGKQMKKVMVNGKDYNRFDKDKEIVVIKGQQGTVDIIVQY